MLHEHTSPCPQTQGLDVFPKQIAYPCTKYQVQGVCKTFSLRVCMLQAIKTWRLGRPGNKARVLQPNPDESYWHMQICVYWCIFNYAQHACMHLAHYLHTTDLEQHHGNCITNTIMPQWVSWMENCWTSLKFSVSNQQQERQNKVQTLIDFSSLNIYSNHTINLLCLLSVHY